jgi:hypothetical protein
MWSRRSRFRRGPVRSFHLLRARLHFSQLIRCHDSAITNVALPHGKNKKAKSALAATETAAMGRQPGSRRAASAIVSGASTGRNDQQERDPVHPAVPGGRSSATQHRHINPKPGQDQRDPQQGEQHDRETTCPPVRQLIAHAHRENHNQQASNNKCRNLCPTVRPACQRARPRNLLAATNSQAS